jgi:hypothetical protein
MATIEEGLYAALTNTSGRVYGLVGTRVYPLTIPQEATLPAISYQRVSGPREPAHDGAMGIAQARIQVTITAEAYRTAKDVATSIRDLFPFQGILGGLVDVFVGEVENEVDGYGAQIEAPTVRMDLWFMYAE